LLEIILERQNMAEAYRTVASNWGRHGVDFLEVHELKPFNGEHRNGSKACLLNGA
jgi:hypothetical protein